MPAACDYTGSLLSQGRCRLRATFGASARSPHAPARRRGRPRSGGAPESQAAQERHQYGPIGRLIRYLNSANQVTEDTDDAADNMLSVLKGGEARGCRSAPFQPSDAVLDLGKVRQSASRILVEMTAYAAAARGQTLTLASQLLKACFCLGAARQRTYSGMACIANY